MRFPPPRGESFPCSLVWTWLAIHLPAAEHSGAAAVSFVTAMGITLTR